MSKLKEMKKKFIILSSQL